MNPWQRIQPTLQRSLSPASYANWLEPVRFGHFGDDCVLHLLAPNGDVRDCVKSEFADTILQTARKLGYDASDLTVGVTPSESRPVQGTFDFRRPQEFKSEYTFERFVVGSSNEFAHAACAAVARTPARAYNPLFLYSRPGMGKTHLLQAIGQRMRAADAGMRIVYTSAEDFLNDMVSSLRYNDMQTFHYRYRMADAFLVDDVHIIGAKERTQEEFFHTFNALHNREKQIVLTSDSHPSSIPGLIERLESRFRWGLTADIQPPDLETKLAILDRKAEEQGVRLPPKVGTFVATRLNSNVRELEEAVRQIALRSRFLNGRITMGMVRTVLSTAGAPRPPAGPSIDTIQREVAQHFDLAVADLRARNNARAIAHPRQVAMYLCRHLTKAPLTKIAAEFDKHHTTVLHSVRKIKNGIKQDRELLATVNGLIDKIRVTHNAR